MTDIMRDLNEKKLHIDDYKVRPNELASLVELVDSGKINKSAGTKVLSKMLDTGKGAADIVQEDGLTQESDEGAIGPIVDEILKDNPDAVKDFKAGKKKAVGFLVGQIMRKTKGKVNPQVVNQILQEKLSE